MGSSNMDISEILEVLKNNYQKFGEDNLPFDLVERCYDIQKRYLFEKDRVKTTQKMKIIVEQFVDSEK